MSLMLKYTPNGRITCSTMVDSVDQVDLHRVVWLQEPPRQEHERTHTARLNGEGGYKELST